MKKRYFFAAGFVAISLVMVQQNFGMKKKEKKEKVVTAEKNFIDKAEKILALMRNMHLEQIVPLLFSEETKKLWNKVEMYNLGKAGRKKITLNNKWNYVFDPIPSKIKVQKKRIENLFKPEEIYLTGRLLKWSKRAVAYPLLGAAGFWGTKKLLSSKYFASKDDVTSIDSSLSAKAVIGAFTLPLTALAVDYFTSGKEKTEKQKAEALLRKLVSIKVFIKDLLPAMFDQFVLKLIKDFPIKNNKLLKIINDDIKRQEAREEIEFKAEKKFEDLLKKISEKDKSIEERLKKISKKEDFEKNLKEEYDEKEKKLKEKIKKLQAEKSITEFREDVFSSVKEKTYAAEEKELKKKEKELETREQKIKEKEKEVNERVEEFNKKEKELEEKFKKKE